jgi:hypothetical protein
MGRMMGLEPTTTRFTVWCSNQLNYIRHSVQSLVISEKGREDYRDKNEESKKKFP